MSRLDDGSWVRPGSAALVQVAVATFGILALELALIRWTSGQVRVLAYFNNVVLIASFLGMGTGLALGPRRPGLVHLTLPALLLLSAPLAFSEQLGYMGMVFPDPSVHMWGAEASLTSLPWTLAAYAILLAIISGVIAVFVFAGAGAGQLLSQASGLRGYSADLLGSLIGVLAFAGLTALGTTPPFWLALGALPFAWLTRRPLSLACALAVVVLGQVSVKGAVFSPYNRIDVEPGPPAVLHVNRDFHQYMHDLRAPQDEVFRLVKLMYETPFALAGKRERALVMGAGTGNDVQAALRQGFAHVDSVDIDPRIIELGRRLHPEQPYSDPRARPIVNDARAFLEQHRGEPYDVVAYGLVDSHAMFSSLSTLRLDNYLYTEEGLRSAWRHVAPGGHLSLNMSFAAGPWMKRRLYWTLARATGTRPVVIEHEFHSASMMIAARPESHIDWTKIPFPAGPLPGDARGVLTTSDDWPFLYLRPGTTPWGYILILGFLLTTALALTVYAHGRAALRTDFDVQLFLMGAAFLLLETRGVTSLSLLFGSTWIVNAVVFGGVLAMALAANLAVDRFGVRSTRLPFAVLLASVLLLWAVNVSSLNALPLAGRAVVGGLLTGLPVGCAGIVVSILLARSRNLPAALAANLLGSVVGGCLEYLSMYTGLSALALLSLGLYLGALLIELRQWSAAGVGQPVDVPSPG
jgi:hypothetical protein